MKHIGAGIVARNSVPMLLATLMLTACESPMRPAPLLHPEAVLLRSQAATAMKRVAELAGTRPEHLRGVAPEEVHRRLSAGVARLSERDRAYKLAFFGAQSFDGLNSEMAAVRRFSGRYYGALMRKVLREQADAIKLVIAHDPGWETTFDCAVGIDLDVTTDCEGGSEEWIGDDWFDEDWLSGDPLSIEGFDSPYCLKEAAAYTGAYLYTLAAVRAYAARPSRETLNAVLFSTATWFYAADVLAACIDRELQKME